MNQLVTVEADPTAVVLEDLAQAIWDESGHEPQRARRLAQMLALVAVGHLEAVESV